MISDNDTPEDIYIKLCSNEGIQMVHPRDFKRQDFAESERKFQCKNINTYLQCSKRYKFEGNAEILTDSYKEYYKNNCIIYSNNKPGKHTILVKDLEISNDNSHIGYYTKYLLKSYYICSLNMHLKLYNYFTTVYSLEK